MKALFVHDHQFYKKGENFYSDKLPYNIWQRYLRHFDKLSVYARQAREEANEAKMPLSSGDNVEFFIGPNIPNPKSFLGTRKRQAARLKKLISDADVTIIRLPSEYGEMAVSICRKLKKTYTLEVVGCAWDSYWNYGNLKAKIYGPIMYFRMKYTVRNAPNVTYVSQEFLQKRYPHSKDARVACISNVDIETPSPEVLTRRLEHINNTGTESKLTFGTIGSLKTRYKGVSNAIDVLGVLTNEYPNFEYRVLGAGDTSSYVQQAQGLGIADKVFFDGTLPSGDQVYKWLDTIDIYLHPSFQEGVPRSLIEAMSRGCPSIASTAGGIPELLEDDVLFSPGDDNKMLQILSEKVLDHEWLIHAANFNFEKSKNYSKDILDKIRYDFFEEIKAEIR